MAGLLGHRAVASGRPAFLVAAGVAALLGLVVLGGLGPLRYRRLGDRTGGAGVAAPRMVAGATAIVVLVGAVAAVAVVVPR